MDPGGKPLGETSGGLHVIIEVRQVVDEQVFDPLGLSLEPTGERSPVLFLDEATLHGGQIQESQETIVADAQFSFEPFQAVGKFLGILQIEALEVIHALGEFLGRNR